MSDKNVLLEAIIRMELPGTLPPHGSDAVRQVEFGSLSGSLYTHLGCTMSACFHRITPTGCWFQAERKSQLNSLKVRDLMPQLYLFSLTQKLTRIAFYYLLQSAKKAIRFATQII